MAGIDYAAIRQRIAIGRVLQLIRYQPTSIYGDQWRGPCPLPDHVQAHDSDRCFSISFKRNAYRCFRCQASGNQLDLWAAITQLPLYQATLDLCEKLAIQPLSKPQIRNAEDEYQRTTPPATGGPN